MNRLERDLRESLKHRETPAGFAEKVLSRAYASDKPQIIWSPRRSWQWLTAAALVVLMVGGGLLVQERRRQAENERKKEQLIAGLEITGSKLRQVQDRLTSIQQRIIELHLKQ